MAVPEDNALIFLKRYIDGEVRKIEETMGGGSCKTHDEYMGKVGEIIGFNKVKREIEDLEHKSRTE